MVEISTAAIQKHGKQNTGHGTGPQNTRQRSAGGRMQDAGAAGQRAEISIAAIQKHGKQNTGRQNHRAAEHTAAEHRRQNARQENTGFALPNRLKMRRIGTVAFGDDARNEIGSRTAVGNCRAQRNLSKAGARTPWERQSIGIGP